MKEKQARIQALIQSIIRYLEAHRSDNLGVGLTLDKLAAMNLPDQPLVDVPPQRTRHEAVLQDAIACVTAPELQEIATCLSSAKDDLVWREDNAQYYPPGADLGEGYKRCNFHTLLIGPDGCGYQQADFNLGFFMLDRHTLYRDHNHAAPELYLNLSPKSSWRFNLPQWEGYPAGSLIWNPAYAPHATRVDEHPFISVFAWLEKVHSPCNVIQFDDWAEIEQAFAKTQALNN